MFLDKKNCIGYTENSNNYYYERSSLCSQQPKEVSKEMLSLLF